jgi:hypothetical protein
VPFTLSLLTDAQQQSPERLEHQTSSEIVQQQEPHGPNDWEAVSIGTTPPDQQEGFEAHNDVEAANSEEENAEQTHYEHPRAAVPQPSDESEEPRGA